MERIKCILIHSRFTHIALYLLCIHSVYGCKNYENNQVVTGAEKTGAYIQLLKGKNVGIVANQTSLVKNTHLIDTLLTLNIMVKKAYSPEHGFRGYAEAGEEIKNSFDEKNNLEIISLYGKNYKPSRADLEGIDVMLFDIQDVGVRFYTYISTLHYVMEACGENNIPVVILDRPNPNGFYVDGPVLNKKYKSFVGLHAIPVVHGLTVAELANMINELWLDEKQKCNLKWILCDNYNHDVRYQLPVPPSPNLPNMRAVYLYPSLGLFEGTIISVGRGTDSPFQLFGHPGFEEYDTTFVPRSIPGKSKYPKHLNDTCYGKSLRSISHEELSGQKQINLEYLIDAYQNVNNNNDFFNSYFYNLVGNAKLKKQVTEGKSVGEIRESWQPEIDRFKKIRKSFLLYPDFE